MTAPAYAVIDAATRALRAIGAHNLTLNDPNGDGSGNGAKAPDGDDYNVVLDALEEVADLLNVSLGWTMPVAPSAVIPPTKWSDYLPKP